MLLPDVTLSAPRVLGTLPPHLHVCCYGGHALFLFLKVIKNKN